MKRLVFLAALVFSGCASTNQRADLVAEALRIHCQAVAIQPLVANPEQATAAQLLEVVEQVKHCADISDAGPAL